MIAVQGTTPESRVPTELFEVHSRLVNFINVRTCISTVMETCCVMPLEERPPPPQRRPFGRGEQSIPWVDEVVLGAVPDFIDFHIHLPTFLWQLRCFVERIIRKRLSDSFIHNSAIVRLSANSSCVSPYGFLLQFRLLL